MLEIRAATQQDLDAVMELVRLCYGDDAEPPAWWRWRHFDRLDGDTTILLAWMDGRLVGMRPFALLDYLVNGRAVTGALLSAVMVHPHYRRRGIFRRLVNAALESAWEQEAVFATTMPNDQSLPGFLELGWHNLGDRRLLVRPLVFDRLAHSRLGRRLASLAPRLSQPPALETNRVDTWSPEAGDLTEAFAKGRGGVVLRRGHDWLSWRYVGAPGNQYVRLETRGESGQLAGLAVVARERRWGMDVGYLVDVVAADRADRRQLIRAALGELEGDGAKLAATVVSDPTLTADLLQLGFAPVPYRLSPKRFHTVVQNRGNVPTRIDDWYLTLGDWDGI